MIECCLEPEWITSTLRSITRNHRNLQRVIIDAADAAIEAEIGDGDTTDPAEALGKTTLERWLELDDLLAQLRDSHSIRLEVLYGEPMAMDESDARIWMSCLLPAVAIGKGGANLIGGVM
jgi:hypothetical protein